jgi:hypothetical protein
VYSMTEVVLSQAAISQIHEAKEYLRLRDSAGNVLGYFVPIDPSLSQVVLGAKSPLSPEERERRSKDQGGKTLDEFWAEMKQKYPEKFQ